jgi:molybdopterin molybdotransferase
MIAIQNAIELIHQNLPEPKIEKIPLQDALQRVLAEPIIATTDMPPFTNSGMDGFAVRWEDVKTASEVHQVSLQVVDESRAGVPSDLVLQTGQAMRISTGAMLCRGADTVIPVEDTVTDGDVVLIKLVKKCGQNVRQKGEEYLTGSIVLPKHTLMNPAQIAVAASHGYARITVYQRPVASVIGTGTELVPIDQTPAPGQIRDSNGIMMQMLLKRYGADVVFCDQVGDTPDATKSAIKRAADLSDIILLTGGVSVGPHDLVKAASEACGFRQIFWRVRQKPGKPLFFAKKGEKLLFGLPGNPVSAYMCFLHYVQPVLRALNGQTFGHHHFWGEVGETIHNNMDRALLMRIKIHPREGALPLVKPLPRQASHMLGALSNADGYILLAPQSIVEVGNKIVVYEL